MRNIVGIIGALATIYFGEPKFADLVFVKNKKIAVLQVQEPMTKLSTISNVLTASASTTALYTPTPVLQKMLGHASWNMTMKYVHIAQSSMLGYTKHLGGMYKTERDANKIAKLNFKRSS